MNEMLDNLHHVWPKPPGQLITFVVNSVDSSTCIQERPLVAINFAKLWAAFPCVIYSQIQIFIFPHCREIMAKTIFFKVFYLLSQKKSISPVRDELNPTENVQAKHFLSKQVHVIDFKLHLWILVLVNGESSAAQCQKQPAISNQQSATALLRNFNVAKQLQNGTQQLQKANNN